MIKKTVSRCALGFEALEDKVLLAGDVAVGIIDGDLFVHGDELSNHVSIVADSANQQFVIRGLPDADGVDTTLNGQSAPIRIDGIGGDVRVRMGGGADTVDVPRGSFQSLGIDTGRGDDHVRLGAQPGDGDANDDPSSEGPVSDARLDIAGNLRVILGGGDDGLRANGVHVGRQVAVSGGRGADRIGLSDVMASQTRVRTGGGDDGVAVNDSRMRNLMVHTGVGKDDVAIIDSAFENLRVGLGRGNDDLAVGATTARTAILDGGRGFDRLNRLGMNHAERLAIVNFEFVASPDADDTDDTNGDDSDDPATTELA